MQDTAIITALAGPVTLCELGGHSPHFSSRSEMNSEFHDLAGEIYPRNMEKAMK